MHHYKDLLQRFLAERLEHFRRKRHFTQEIMAEKLHISPRFYAYLGCGTYGSPARTLMFFRLFLHDEVLFQFHLGFYTLAKGWMAHGVA